MNGESEAVPQILQYWIVGEQASDLMLRAGRFARSLGYDGFIRYAN